MIMKIAITDDHVMVRKGIISMLAHLNNIRITGSYENAEQTTEGLVRELPDILLLDIGLPDINGIDLTKTLVKKYPELKIIALTNFDNIAFVKHIVKNGAAGYLLKNTDRKELLKAFKTVLANEHYIQEDIQKNLLRQSSISTENPMLNIKLTRREQDVLIAISEELTTVEISKKLYISQKTVETHRMNIMNKFGTKNSVGMIKMAIKLGLV